MSTPTQGRIVIYTLSADDAAAINRRRTTGQSIAERIAGDKWPIGAQAHIGAAVVAGDTLPAIVVKVRLDGLLQLRVFLDGTDDFWAEQVDEAAQGTPGTWAWPTRT